MKVTQSTPGWMVRFHAEHGVWPIAGGAGEENPPAEGGVTVTDSPQEGAPSTEHPYPGETPPATPVPTNAVDPGAFQRGSQEAPGQTSPGPVAGQTQNPETGRTFTAEEVERFRAQERDKLYPRIEEMANELKELRAAREAEQAEREAREAEEREAAKKAEEEGLDTKELLERRLSEAEKEWTQKFTQLEEERERDRAMLEKERQLNVLNDFKREQLEAHEDDIMPHLRDLVGGESEEEILASIERAKQKTAAILQDVQAAGQAQRQQVPTSRVTSPGAGGPMETVEQQTRTLSPTDIRNMSMQEYAKVRDQLRQASANQYRGG